MSKPTTNTKKNLNNSSLAVYNPSKYNFMNTILSISGVKYNIRAVNSFFSSLYSPFSIKTVQLYPDDPLV